MTDPIADFLNRLNNASRARRMTVSVSPSKMKRALAEVLKVHGFIASFEEDTELVCTLREDRPLHIKCMSKPGQRIYSKAKDLKPVRRGFGVAILSTSQGIMTNTEAKKKNLGGELICTVY